MPTDYIKKLAKTTDKSEKELEQKWEEAKQQAKKQGHEEDYDYITSIFKKMIGESDTIKTLKQFIKEK